MKHCPRCNKEYEDKLIICRICNRFLKNGRKYEI